MRNDYQPYFDRLKSLLGALGYASVRESEFEAEFHLHSGWTLLFACERYYGPMFSILVVPPKASDNRKGGYEVGLLMKVFEKLENRSYGPPSIDGQVSFLLQEKDKVFGDCTMYDAEYDKLNNLGAHG